MFGSCLKESYTAQNSLELNSLPGPPHHSMQNKELSHPKKKKWTLRLICPAPNGSSLSPSRLKDNYSEQPWRRTGPLKTVEFHIYAYIYILFSWVSAAAH